MKKPLIPYHFLVILAQSGFPTGQISAWMLLLAYLAYLQASRPQRATEAEVLRTLIVVVGLVLCVVALVAARAPDVATELVKHWPIVP